jgi:hypothetical protein
MTPSASQVPGTRTRVVTLAATLAFTVVLLVALVSSFAQARPSANPLPAPRPVAALADFPDQARPSRACLAILTTASAVDNPRAPRANEITSALLADACAA